MPSAFMAAMADEIMFTPVLIGSDSPIVAFLFASFTTIVSCATYPMVTLCRRGTKSPRKGQSSALATPPLASTMVELTTDFSPSRYMSPKAWIAFFHESIQLYLNKNVGTLGPVALSRMVWRSPTEPLYQSIAPALAANKACRPLAASTGVLPTAELLSWPAATFADSRTMCETSMWPMSAWTCDSTSSGLLGACCACALAFCALAAAAAATPSNVVTKLLPAASSLSCTTVLSTARREGPRAFSFSGPSDLRAAPSVTAKAGAAAFSFSGSTTFSA
mmetsp:Transcript_86680/g.230303  ORF Transcript_86680/g.230303 Transcript_86680/m.230303 type:complete len:277 (-) Transcript_86680:642-1472(-)